MSGNDDLLTMLSDQAGRLFGDLIDRELLMSVEAGERPAALAEAVEAFGLADALAIAPEDGGLRFADAGALFALFGYHAVPLPIGETMLARCVLARAGIEAPAGAIGLANGDSASVGFAPEHLLLSRDGKVHLIPTDGLAAEAQASISRQPRALFDLTTVAPLAETAWPNALPDTATLGAMLRASQIAGAVGRVLALSVEYANVRQQFGRPIGRFQAVQQLLAKLAAEAAAARSAADVAWAALDAGQLGHAGSIAKIRAGEAARIAAAIAHQVHGAIGVTDEHMLHYFTRRLWEWRLDFGSDGHWAERLGRAAREAEGGLWQFLTTGCGAPQSAKETT
jgi:acyl-CoA dehydrogenase